MAHAHTTLFGHTAPDRDAAHLGEVRRDRDPGGPATVRLGGDQGPQPPRLAVPRLPGRLPHRVAESDREAEGRYSLCRQADPYRWSAASDGADGCVARLRGFDQGLRHGTD